MSIKINENIIEVNNNIGQVYKFDWLRLSKYWEYANLDDNETIRAACDDNYLSLILLTAQGQGGICAIIDMNKDKIIHIHNAAFAMKSIVYNDKVITLSDVSSFSHKPTLYVDSIDINNMEYVEPSQTIEIDLYKSFDEDCVEMIVNFDMKILSITDGKEKLDVNIDKLI